MSTLEHINVSLLNERDSVNEELLRVGARGRREAVDDAYTAELAAAEELSKRQKAETANKKLSLELTNARKACEGMRQQLAEMQRQMAQEASTSQLHETARAKRLAQRAAEVQDEEMEEEEEEEEEEEVDSDDDEDSDDEYIPPGKLVRFLTRAPTISSNPEQLSVLMLDPHDIPSLVRLSNTACIASAALAPFDAACIASATLPAMNAAFITSVALSCWKGKEAVFVSSCVLR